MGTTVLLQGLSTGYRLRKGEEKVISRNLCAELHEGELTCLLGPNGAGKSTLLRTLAAFQPALGGKVLVGGRDIASYQPKELAKQVGVVLTTNADIRNMTVEEVVAMGRSPYTGFWGKLRERDEKVVEKCLQWIGIEEFRARKMQTLSDGERQKVMIAKAIAQETPIVLLDEPTAYLDYPSKVGMMQMLHRLAKALKKTIFMSTHDLEHALQAADQVWLLDREHGLSTGLPEDLCAAGLLETYFDRPGLHFDRATLSFSMDHEVAREVLFEGDEGSLEYQLAARAFRRNAIRPVRTMAEAQMDSTLPSVKVRVPGDGTYRMVVNGEETACAIKIEQILEIANKTIVKRQIQDVRDAAQMTPYE